ncbi:hypothetical protein [Flavobacterium oreochromis]|uniref:hypothetical protein n=1 Tax=Flavobacterium oreochromis TaxID=2906078 RepID=UPI00385F987D
MRIILILILFLNFVSCNEEKSAYIISREWDEYTSFLNVVHKDKDGNVLPPPPLKYKYGYSCQNFIIDDNSNLFYYQFKPNYPESCIYKGKDTVPYFQDLKSEMLIEIPINSIEDFVCLNFKKGREDKVKISSNKDTLNSTIYFNLIRALNKQLDYEKDRDVYAIFPTTQEEDTILYYKKNKDYYFSSQIKWDLRRIKFFPKPKIKS